jgi:hypothetical protein
MTLANAVDTVEYLHANNSSVNDAESSKYLSLHVSIAHKMGLELSEVKTLDSI